jgi:glycine/D-amino acid oxidase-like deaminating enzyme
VINCAGRWADRVARDPEFLLPLAPTVGFMAFTPPVATSISHPILSPTLDVRPDGAGRLMIRHYDLDEGITADAETSPTMPHAMELMRRAEELIPALKGVKPEAARVTARSMPKDGLSAIGPVPQVKNYYFAVTHSGVTLAALFANVVADEVALGKHHPELDDFRPGRFFN